MLFVYWKSVYYRYFLKFVLITFYNEQLHNVFPALPSCWCLIREVTRMAAKYQPDDERIVPLKMSLIFSLLSPV